MVFTGVLLDPLSLFFITLHALDGSGSPFRSSTKPPIEYRSPTVPRFLALLYSQVLSEILPQCICSLQSSDVSVCFRYGTRNILLTCAIWRANSSSFSIFSHSSQNSFRSESASSRHTRLKLARDMGSMMSCHFLIRTSLYLSRMLSSALPSFIAISASKRLPTSAIPPVNPSPPLVIVLGQPSSVRQHHDLQWIAQMCRISCQEKSTHSEGLCTSLMQFVWAGTRKFIVTGLWVPGQDLRKSFWLTGEIFLIRQAPDISVSHSPQSTVSDPRSHIPVIFVDDEVGIPVPEFLEVIINLANLCQCLYANSRCFYSHSLQLSASSMSPRGS